MATDTLNETGTAADARLAHDDAQAHDGSPDGVFAYDDFHDDIPGGSPGAAHGEDVIAQGELDSGQILERTVLYALDQGVEMLEQNGGFEPFTVLVSGEELYIEDQPGETEEESYENARRTIYQMERMCNAYVFCYDGYVDLEDGVSDAVVVEYAARDDKNAQIIVKVYHQHDDHYHFDETLYQVGDTETLFSDGGAPDDGADEKEPEAAASDPDKLDATVVERDRRFGEALDVVSDPDKLDTTVGAAKVAADVGKGVATAAGEITLEGIVSAAINLLP